MQNSVAKKNYAVYIALVVRQQYVCCGCIAQLVEQLTLNQWVWGSNPHAPTINKDLRVLCGGLFLLVALQKTPSLLGAECQGVGTTPLHANERGQTVRFVAVIEPPVYWGISIPKSWP